MEIMKSVEFKDGKIMIDVGAMVKPAIVAFKAKVQSGDIDPVKGTDLDKEVMIKALDAILAQI